MTFKKFKIHFATIWCFLFLIGFGNIHVAQSQNFGLSVLTVSDTSLINENLKNFDSVWNECLKLYGKKDVSHLFLKPHRSQLSKSNPITLLNFISGIEIPLNQVFPFKLVEFKDVNDTLKMAQMDMGWMQLAILFHPKLKKLVQFTDVNFYQLKECKYKNLIVYSAEKLNDTLSIRESYNTTLRTMSELGIPVQKFTDNQYIVYSGNTIDDAYRFVGGLQYVHYFDVKNRYGGMGDPFNPIVLSGIKKPIHTHEIIHKVVDFETNLFIGEGIASLYGGIGADPYQLKMKMSLELVNKHNIRTFKELISNGFNSEFNSNRVLYAIAAHVLNHVRNNFEKSVYQQFVRNCKTEEQMITYLKELYKIQSEEKLFEKLVLAKSEK